MMLVKIFNKFFLDLNWKLRWQRYVKNNLTHSYRSIEWKKKTTQNFNIIRIILLLSLSLLLFYLFYQRNNAQNRTEAQRVLYATTWQKTTDICLEVSLFLIWFQLINYLLKYITRVNHRKCNQCPFLCRFATPFLSFSLPLSHSGTKNHNHWGFYRLVDCYSHRLRFNYFSKLLTVHFFFSNFKYAGTWFP